ncbi:MAG TPA: ABC transporter ATP-binding protein [Terriglobales bacterium]|nr:ABC transporter ATP-binding protein [Terriglobales bacterium]
MNNLSDNTPDGNKAERGTNFRAVVQEIGSLVRTRKRLLVVGFILLTINRISGLILPYSTQFVIDNVIAKRQTNLLVPIVGGALLATLIQGTSSFALTQLLPKAAQRLIADLRIKVQGHVGRLPVAYYDASKTGNLLARIMSDVEGVSNLIGLGLVELVGGLMSGCIAMIVLFWISSTMTVIAIAFLSVFAIGLHKALAFIRPMFRERSAINADVSGRLTESLAGVRVVKAYHAEAREHVVFSQGVQRLLDNILKAITAMSVTGLWSSILFGLMGTVVMFVGVRQILNGGLTIGRFFTFTMLLGYLAGPFSSLVRLGTQLTEAVVGLERTRELLNERPEDEDPNRAMGLGRLNGHIEFQHIDFEYELGKPVLRDVSFEASPGTVTALVGSSGSGKSTIIGLLAAFYVPKSGQILIDGNDLSKVKLDSYRTQLGMVSQESFLFAGTIRENIMFSCPRGTEKELMRACCTAHVDEFADRFTNGYDTVIGERGVRLSGGQRQRVSIARAILSDPRILILDEATSSLDSQSERLIQEGLSYLMKGRTTFVIAHRLSTIRHANQILVVEAGRIVECGTHESLYAKAGRYTDLYNSQQSIETNLFLAPGETDIQESPPGY